MQQLDLDGHWKYDNILWIGSSKQQAQAKDGWIDSDARSQASTSKRSQASTSKRSQASTSSMKDSSSNSGRTPAANRNQTSLACRRAVDRGSCYGRTTTKLPQLRGRADGRGKRQVDGHATGGERWGGRIRDLQIRRCRRRQARRRRWMRRGRPATGGRRSQP